MAKKAVTVTTNEKEMFKSLLSGDVKDHLWEIEEAKIDLEVARDKLIDAVWSDYWNVEHATTTEWDCPDSPFGYCAYHRFEDRAWDNCLFCHEPYERK